MDSSSSNNSSNNTNISNTSVTTNNTSATNSSANNTIANSSSVPKKSGPVGLTDAEFQAAVAVTKYSLIFAMDNMSAEYNQSSNTIIIAIIVPDSTDGVVAKALADATLKILNAEVNYYNNSVKLSDTSNYTTNYYGRYHGGLYDECNVAIGVAPISHANDPDYYYVFQYIPAGGHTPISRLR
ncbi:hypothetical protein [Methanolapillus africanus]|uniref:hypothetical protein n=1 Tax=Methanolapillus africanus TaxID=3028297 RepID=UPI0030B8BAA2